MVKIGELLKGPIQDKQWMTKVAIGGVVSAVPILSFCEMGYLVRLLRSVIGKKEEVLPEWSDWGKLFSDGIIYFVISFVYMLVPALIFTVGITAGRSVLGLVLGGFIIFIAAVTLLAVGFILPMAICHYVATGDIKSAFAWKVIQEKIKSTAKEYGSAYLMAIGLFVAAYIVCFLLGLIIIGWILFPFLFFYLSIVLARMFAEIYPAESVEEEKTT